MQEIDNYAISDTEMTSKSETSRHKENNRAAPTKSVRTAIAILRLLNKAQALPLREISNSVESSKSTTYRILAALIEDGLVVQDQATGVYSLHFGVVALSASILESRELVTIARDRLQPVHAITEETVGLHVRLNAQRVCVVEFESLHQLRMVSGIGNVYPLHAGAAGKAILAFSDAARRALFEVEILQSITPETTVDLDQLEHDLLTVRNSGYAESSSEVTSGARAIAVPVFDRHGDAIAAGYVAGPAVRLSPNAIEQARLQLMEACARISTELGYAEKRA